MCGIAGLLSYNEIQRPDNGKLQRMVGSLYHRGPDECGFFYDRHIAMGMSRLSIIDLAGGSQPIHNEDKTLWIVFNGEVFNYIELKEELLAKGHKFYTTSDTEVILHCYQEYGLDFVQHLNGQFAISIWDTKANKLVLARDRVGIRPLFYAKTKDKLIYASEIKAIFAEGTVKPQIKPDGIADIFTFWVNIPPHSVFEDINELPPGHLLIADEKGINIKCFWSYSFPENNEFNKDDPDKIVEDLREILYDAVTIRLRADVPVASYLSGGIDSSIISAMVKKYHNNELITFSVTFKDKDYDERSFQQQMADKIGTRHHAIEVDDEIISRNFEDVVWYAEKPLMRTAPSPLYALSGLVRSNDIKVVLTGEGADEIFGGYNIFKEDKVRRFWARSPESAWRPLLLSRLYPYILKSEKSVYPFWQAFFKSHLAETADPYYSHLLRWDNTSMVRMIFNQTYKDAFQYDQQIKRVNDYTLPEMKNWHSLNRAQYLEAAIFMNGYLLSSQGDRMMMGNSIEGRFPFLDHRVIEFAGSLPPDLKIKGLTEKYILKESYTDLIPEEIVKRAKQPYRAPIASVFLSDKTSPRIKELLSKEMIEKYGYFNYKAVKQLKSKLRRTGSVSSARDEMAIVSCASTQLLHFKFIEKFAENNFKLPEKQSIVNLT